MGIFENLIQPDEKEQRKKVLYRNRLGYHLLLTFHYLMGN